MSCTDAGEAPQPLVAPDSTGMADGAESKPSNVRKHILKAQGPCLSSDIVTSRGAVIQDHTPMSEGRHYW